MRVDGAPTPSTPPERLRAMYRYLDAHGELCLIERLRAAGLARSEV